MDALGAKADTETLKIATKRQTSKNLIFKKKYIKKYE